jgi:hypothetical protein
MRRALLLFLAACFLASLARADGLPLKAIATADSTEVHPDSVFEVTLSLQNLTGAAQTIKIPEANWDRDWRSSNPLVSWDAWNSDEEGDITIEIPPHGAYVFPLALKMFVDDSVKKSRIDFRMGFRTTKFGKTVWSSPITLDVIP